MVLELGDGIYTCRFYLLCLQCCGCLYNTTLLSGYGTSTRHKEPEHFVSEFGVVVGVWIRVDNLLYTVSKLFFFDPCV